MTEPVVLMTAAELEAEVDRQLAAEIEKRRAAMRLEIADRVRREAFQRKMDWIQRRGREVDAAQLAFDTDPQRAVELEASRKVDAERRAASAERYAREEGEREQRRREYFARKR
jgi:hypothetical protein